MADPQQQVTEWDAQGKPLPAASAPTEWDANGKPITSTPPSAQPGPLTQLSNWWDKTTEPYTRIVPHQMPHSAGDVVNEIDKGIQNIGGGALGTVLHPLNTLGGMADFALRSSPVGGLVDTLRGKPTIGQEMGTQLAHQPLETIEQGIGQAGAMPGFEAELGAPLNAAKMGSKILRGGANIIAGTTPAVAESLVKTTQAANAAAEAAAADAAKTAATKHLTDTQAAMTEQQGREFAHQHALRTKEADIQTQRLSDINKAAADHAAEVQQANEHNQRVIQKHQQAVQRTTEANQAAEQTAAMRSQAADKLAQETEKYYAQEDAVKAQSKAEENAAWNPWRAKMQNATIDGAEISEPLKKLATISPEVERTLRQLEPRGDEVPPDSPYRQLQDQVAKSNFGAQDYQGASPAQQAAVDKVLQSMGEEPPSIDFDPEPGKPIPVEQVHRANSILQRYISSGRFEGPLLGEMKQVAKVLRSTITKASDANGALDDLNAARQATVKYQQAFGRERGMPVTQDEIREKQANPEAFKERDDQARLDAASRVDPTLVDAYSRVKALRDEVKKFPSEDQLRKGQKQVPAPPTVNDLRPGYRLKPTPQPPQKLLATPASEVAAQEVKQPELPNYPNRPPESVADVKKIGLKDIQGAKKAAREQRSHALATKGTVYGGLGIGAMSILRNILHPSIETTGMEAAGIATPYAISRALRNERVARFLDSPTPSDIAAVPPDLRADLPELIKAAQAQGMKVHPAILALGAASKNSK